MTRRTRRTGIVVLPLALALLAAGTAAQSSRPATFGASTPEFQDDVSETGLWGCRMPTVRPPDADGAIEMTFGSEGWSVGLA